MCDKSIINDEGRTCSKCRIFKLWSEYSKNKTTATGYQARCKLCCSVGQKPYLRRNKVDHKTEIRFSNAALLFYLGIKKAS